jgi:hypothetical protein
MAIGMRRLFLAIALIGALTPIPAAFAQSQMPDQRATSHVLAGPGLAQNGRTLSLSIPVAASNGGAGTVTGILKANGLGTVSAAAAGTDYAPATSGTAMLKGNGAGGFSSALSGTDYAPPTSGSAILKGNGSGGFASAASGTDYAPATSGSAILKGNGSGGFSNAVSGTDYQTPIPGTTLPAHNFANSISSGGILSGSQPGFGDLSGSLASSQMPALTGDTTSSAGSTLTTTSKVNGVSYPSGPATDTVPLITAANTATYKAIGNCVDSGGSHLNYSTSTHSFSCGTSSSSNTPSFVTAMTASASLTYGGL